MNLKVGREVEGGCKYPPAFTSFWSSRARKRCMSFGTVVDIVGGVKLNEPRLEASSFQSVDRVDQLHLEILVLVVY